MYLVKVHIDAIKAAGRANHNIISRVVNLGIVSITIFVVGIAISVCVLTTAENWGTEAVVQSTPWELTDAASEAGEGIGALFDPVGTVLGGATGSILGGIMSEGVRARSTKWFLWWQIR